MAQRIVLLTAPECAAAVTEILSGAGADVRPAFTADSLKDALAPPLDHVRLIAVGTGVIVPSALLAALPGPAYNLHPGPPEYPGLYPSVHALYERAESFGVTLHEMAETVDSGPIVAVARFPIPAACDRLRLDALTFAAMLDLLRALAAALVTTDTPLPRAPERWSGRRRSAADFAALCQLPPDADDAEFHRRLRAVGEGPHHALSFERFGRTFRLVSDHPGPVTRGGQPAVS
jgi:methionyl-tRNA formyltransferase